MESKKSSALTMVLNMLVPSSLTFCTSWGITHETSSPHYPPVKWICRGTCKISEACTSMCYSTCSADPQLTLLVTTELLQLMPSSHHLLSPCTNTSLGPPSLPKSATLNQQPSKFVNGMLPTLTPSDHRLINTANLLHPCMLVSQLPCMIPFTRFASPLQWYASYPRTATRCTPAMVLST